MSLSAIKLITFDATNTVLKFRLPPWHHYAEVARNHGFKGSGEDVKKRLLLSYKAVWNKYPNFGKGSIGWENWWIQVVKSTFEGMLPVDVNINIVAQKLIDDFKSSTCWYAAPGGNRLIKLIRDKSIKVGVISNFDTRLYDVLRHVGVHHYFDFVIISYDVGFCKPDARIFQAAIEKCGDQIKPCECVHIGDDMEKDYMGARSAGWHALLITDKCYTSSPPQVQHVFKNFEDLSLSIEDEKLIL